MNAVLLQHAYEGTELYPCLELNNIPNTEYCKKHNFDYKYGANNLPEYFEGISGKTKMIHDALFKGYEYVVWLDADTLISDFDTDLRDGCPKGIGVCWHRSLEPVIAAHWNIGAIYIRNSEEVKNFVSSWISRCPGEPPWWEQGVFNDLARATRVVQTISDRWNATLDCSMVPDAVVLGFHGQGRPPARYNEMKLALDQLQQKRLGGR